MIIHNYSWSKQKKDCGIRRLSLQSFLNKMKRKRKKVKNLVSETHFSKTHGTKTWKFRQISGINEIFPFRKNFPRNDVSEEQFKKLLGTIRREI